MSVLTKVAVGGATATALTVLGLTMAGVATTTVVVALDPLAPAARADGLTSFDSCAELRSWYVERGVAEVGPYGWGGGMIAYAEDATAAMPGAATDLRAQSRERTSSSTGTNTQEAEVDEPDVAKTDGVRVVRMTSDGDLVVTDVSGPAPRELGRVRVPDAAGYGDELLLIGEHALVIGHDFAPVPMPLTSPTDRITTSSSRMMAPGGTRVVDVDLSDPTAPRIADVDRYVGRLISARTYGTTVRLVTETGRPELGWVYPQDPGTGNGPRVTEAEATARNQALVRATRVEDWLPSLRTDDGRTPLVGCDEVLHPPAGPNRAGPGSGQGTIAVTTFPADDLDQRTSVAVTADGHVVYSSADRLYVAASHWDHLLREDPAGPDGPVSSVPDRPGQESTDLHAFALDGLQTRYVASGTIRGTVRDRWSLDEHDGVLRVAWTRQGAAGTTNGISTLREQAGRLSTVGELGDLGTNETIQSVRWLDDLAILVTFRQIDPLYTVDLGDPAHPRALGELKIPGYSGYLHPVGGNRLLGLGVEATTEGRNLGSQASVFDISDLADPVRSGTVGLGRETSLPALEDPRAFTWLPDRATGITTTQSWNTGASRLVALTVAPNGSLNSRDLLAGIDGWQTRVLPLADGRIAVVDRGVTVLSLD